MEAKMAQGKNSQRSRLKKIALLINSGFSCMLTFVIIRERHVRSGIHDIPYLCR
jgi:hypothetical protein